MQSQKVFWTLHILCLRHSLAFKKAGYGARYGRFETDDADVAKAKLLEPETGGGSPQGFA